jgi:ribosomal-protein-alanine N-acetyltransferase
MNKMPRPSLPTVLPELQGARIILRTMGDADAASLFDIYGDPQVMEFTDESPFPDLKTVDVMLQSVGALLVEGTSLEWAVALKNSGALLGTCGLHSFDEASGTAEVGCLLKQSAWGHGYMSEAIHLLMTYARDVLRLDRLAADVAPENKRAQRLFDKLGYRQNQAGLWAASLATS